MYWSDFTIVFCAILLLIFYMVWKGYKAICDLIAKIKNYQTVKLIISQ